jgi:PleD family two-component response regulator
VGIAHDADGMRATGDVLRDADRALYRAKAAGRNRVVAAA